MGKDVIKIKREKGEEQVSPVNWMVSSFVFKKGEEAEAALAHQMAEVAEKNGMSANDMAHIFPLVLRMLKSNIDWAK